MEVVAAKTPEAWKVYLINHSLDKLENVMISSKGYGNNGGEEQRTSVLRHSIPYLDPEMYAMIEPIDASVFHLTNEYWVSYYIEDQVFDKKFLFKPHSISEESLENIKLLSMQGISAN